MNFGLDTTFDGRCVTRWLLNASLDGIGPYRLTPIFPISIWRYKRDINDREGTPNYDLFKLAIKSLSKRVYPNMVNCDWVSNKPDTHPTHLISKPILSGDAKVTVYSEDDISSPLVVDIKTLVEQYKDKYPTFYRYGVFNIDCRFTKPSLFITDKYSKYNDYCVNSIDDHLAKINYISFTEEMDKFSITTSSFRHDFINDYGAEDEYQSEHFNYEYKSSTEMATMGSCDGVETITYRKGYDGRIYQISFEDLFDELAQLYKVERIGKASYIDFESPSFEDKPLYIYDSSIMNFTKVKKIIRNDDIGVWNLVKFEEDNKFILLTDDHPLPTQRGRIFVKDLKPGDKIPRAATFSDNIIFSIRQDDTYTVKEVEHLGFRDRYGYDVETETDKFDVSGINSHNCRTMIGYDRHGCGWDKNGRGNVVPVTLNITKLAIKHGICMGERTNPDLDGFYKDLDNLLAIAEKSLLDRYHYIVSQPPSAAYFMYDNATIVDAEKSLEAGRVEPSMIHNTLSIGFLGLANALYALFGKYHNQSKEVCDEGIKIVKRIYDYTKDAANRNNLNFSCYFTPAESCCYTIMKKLQKEFGTIKGVTDHEYLCNSVHCPPYEKISIKDKIDLESKFDWMGTAGHILYVELDASTMKNLDAIESIIHYAMNSNDHRVGYFAINFPIDNCLSCGYSGVMEDGVCPVCGSSGNDIQMLRRVTGYLTADYKTRFNKGKQAEVEERIKHSKYTNMRSMMQK